MSTRPFSPIGVAVFGVSSLYGHWGFNLVQQIVEAATGDTLHLHGCTLDELRAGVGARNGGSFVLTEDLPRADLVEFICTSDLPIVTFSEAAENIFNWVLATRTPDPLDAARFCTGMLASLYPAFAAERALHIVRDAASSDEVVANIVDYLFPGRPPSLADQIYEYLVDTGKFDRYVQEDWAKYDNAASVMMASGEGVGLYSVMKDLVISYSDLTNGVLPQTIDWPQPLFYGPDNKSLQSPIDLTGPSRVLFYGPYVNLPIGAWVVRLEFEIDGALSGIEATTDIYISDVVVQRTFKMPAKGIYAYELSFYVDDPQRAVQIRLFSKSGAIEGVLLPRSVRVRPESASP